MLGKLPFVLGYGVYCQNGGSEKIFFQFLTSCKKCLDAGKGNIFSASSTGSADLLAYGFRSALLFVRNKAHMYFERCLKSLVVLISSKILIYCMTQQAISKNTQISWANKSAINTLYHRRYYQLKSTCH